MIRSIYGVGYRLDPDLETDSNETPSTGLS